MAKEIRDPQECLDLKGSGENLACRVQKASPVRRDLRDHGERKARTVPSEPSALRGLPGHRVSQALVVRKETRVTLARRVLPVRQACLARRAQ